MNQNQLGITKRVVAALLVTAAIAGVSALPIQTAGHNRNSLARSLKNIQTDQAILFYAGAGPMAMRCVERVPAMTGESKALTENLKLAAATL